MSPLPIQDLIHEVAIVFAVPYLGFLSHCPAMHSVSTQDALRMAFSAVESTIKSSTEAESGRSTTPNAVSTAHLHP